MWPSKDSHWRTAGCPGPLGAVIFSGVISFLIIFQLVARMIFVGLLTMMRFNSRILLKRKKNPTDVFKSGFRIPFVTSLRPVDNETPAIFTSAVSEIRSCFDLFIHQWLASQLGRASATGSILVIPERNQALVHRVL